MSFDLSLTPAHHDLIERTHRFAEEVVRPVAARYDREQEFPWPVIEAAAKEGFYNPLFYRDLIGDPTGLSLPLFMEELFWGCAGIGLAVVMPGLALSAMAQAATPEQLLRWAPECFGEPGDLKLAALASPSPRAAATSATCAPRRAATATSGSSTATRCGSATAASRTSTSSTPTVDPELGHRGQALFIVPGGTPGLELVRKLDKLGCRASHTAELHFDGVRIPADNLLGGDAKLEARLEKAREGARRVRHAGRVRADAADGRRAGARDRARGARVRHAATRPSARRSAARSSTSRASRFPLADLAADLDAARLLTWRAAWMAANRVPFQHAEGSMSKLKASEVAQRATEQAIQICGGWGYISDLPVEKWYRDAKLYTIFEGTSEIQRMVIGRALGEAAGEPPLHHSLPGRRAAALAPVRARHASGARGRGWRR